MTITKSATFQFSPADVAKLFWSMDSVEQGEFFNHLGFLVNNDGGSLLLKTQMLDVLQAGPLGLSEYGRLAIGAIVSAYNEQKKDEDSRQLKLIE